MTRTIKARGSKFAEAILEFKGNPVLFGEKYEPQKMVYDLYPEFLVLKAGRQVGKSLGLGGRINIGSVSQKYFSSLYTAPSQIQAKRFSTGYLDVFRESPYINKHYVNSKDVGNVFEKSYTNRSKVFVSYAQSEADADRVRGMTADLWCADEAQDMQLSAVPIIKEILNTSEWGYQIFAGTSKSTANTLEQLWEQTNQCEFVKKCDSCSKWVIPNNFDLCMRMCRNPDHLSCPYCGKAFTFYGGQWVATRPSVKKHGLHLPQLIFGANTKTGSRQWNDLYDKVDQSVTGVLYTPDKIANEIFGLATDLGSTSLTLKEVQNCCNEEVKRWIPHDRKLLTEEEKRYVADIKMTALGVDWSVSGSEGSHTVVCVFGVTHAGRVIVLFSKKLLGVHILTQVAEVVQIAKDYGCSVIGSDRGVGVLQGELMQQRYGVDRVVMCQYVASNRRVRWDKPGNFLAGDRTAAIDDVVHKVRLGPSRFTTPSWGVTEGFWGDALSIYEEETRMGKRVYCKQPSIPDDWIHSVVFGNLAAKMHNGDFSHLDLYRDES